MEPMHENILEPLPEKPPRSKLEPHRELIRELRRKGRTYREVARLFHERLGLHVALSTLHSFVKVRAKHRKRTQFELPPMGLADAEPPKARLQALLPGAFFPEPLLDSGQAAAILKIHPKSLQRMARRGDIRALQIGKVWRFRASVLDEWIQQKLAG